LKVALNTIKQTNLGLIQKSLGKKGDQNKLFLHSNYFFVECLVEETEDPEKTTDLSQVTDIRPKY
jgi:hypothetical protein